MRTNILQIKKKYFGLQVQMSLSDTVLEMLTLTSVRSKESLSLFSYNYMRGKVV